MSLLDKLGRNYVAGSLSMLLAAACGDSTQKNAVPCGSDADCKGDRLCVDGYCEGGEEGDSDGCADSPLTGKYIIRAMYCNTYSTAPFTNCKGRIHHTESWTSFGEENVAVTVDIRYDDMKIFIPAIPEIDAPSPFTYELVREFSDSDVVVDDACAEYGDYNTELPGVSPENDVRLIRCVLSKHPNLYFAKQNGRVCPSFRRNSLFELSNSAFPGESACKSRTNTLYEPTFNTCWDEISPQQ